MAKVERRESPPSEGAEQPPAQRKGGKLLLVAGALGLLLAGGAGAYLAGLVPGRGHEPSPAAAHAEPQRAEALYVAIDPPFTVNLIDGKEPRYVQTTVELLTRDPKTEGAIRRHLPVIRDHLVMLLSNQVVAEVATVEGRERLRSAALASVQKALQAEAGASEVEQVLFTSFVIQ
jgi:flagellar FliL protein